MVCMGLRHRQSLRHAEEGKDEECVHVAKQRPLVFSSLMCLTLYTPELTIAYLIYRLLAKYGLMSM